MSEGKGSLAAFSDFSAFRAWALARAEGLTMRVEPARLDETHPTWFLQDSGSALARRDNLFFGAIGQRITKAAGREVGAWIQPTLIEMSGLGLRLIDMIRRRIPGSLDAQLASEQIDPDADSEFDGKVVLYMDRHEHTLVRLLAEPGNWGIRLGNVNTHALVAPTFAASQGNLVNHERALRGENDPNGQPYRPIPLYETVKGYEVQGRCAWITCPGSGGRQMYLRNRLGRVELSGREKIDTNIELERSGQAQDFAWVSWAVLRQIRDASLANAHLLSAMALMA